MIRYTYPLKDYRTWLKGFARLLNVRVIEKRLQIPPHLGEGYIYASSINQDISYVILNFTLKDDLVLFRKKSFDYGLSLGFSQVEVSDFFKVSEQVNSITDKSPRRNNIFLSSTNYDLELTYSKNSTLKIVGVLFGPVFLRKCLKKDILLDILLYTGQRLQNVNKVPITFEYRQLLDDIFETNTQSPISNLILQNRVLMLTEKFLNTFLEKKYAINETGRRSKEKEKDIQALKEVESILSDEKLEKFPSIESLSKTAMMSSTKLKTKFKNVYGMKLYEFYNRNRLEKAKEMLRSGKYSVKEVGHDIGFSNLSNFAKAFRKEFGILPNEMLRN
ncbi:MAG: helix-turn-helix transcriptional regulator [Bacteroidetes bacterium]|nr:helix-turn-helix transcriptional regulator [Bacteroidota bacterium]